MAVFSTGAVAPASLVVIVISASGLSSPYSARPLGASTNSVASRPSILRMKVSILVPSASSFWAASKYHLSLGAFVSVRLSAALLEDDLVRLPGAEDGDLGFAVDRRASCRGREGVALGDDDLVRLRRRDERLVLGLVEGEERSLLAALGIVRATCVLGLVQAALLQVVRGSCLRRRTPWP